MCVPIWKAQWTELIHILAGAVYSADNGAHGAARHAVHRQTVLLKNLQYAYMGKPARGAAAQGKSDFFSSFFRHMFLRGCIFFCSSCCVWGRKGEKDAA